MLSVGFSEAEHGVSATSEGPRVTQGAILVAEQRERSLAMI
jgi:hypothetical protein